jgi:hypothetical protein
MPPPDSRPHRRLHRHQRSPGRTYPSIVRRSAAAGLTNGVPYDAFLPSVALTDAQPLSRTDDRRGSGTGRAGGLATLFPTPCPAIWERTAVSRRLGQDESGTRQQAQPSRCPRIASVPLPPQFDPQLVFSV